MSDRSVHIVLDSFLPLLQAGIAYTVPLTLISFALGIALAFVTALVRIIGKGPLDWLARFYVWIIRGTPLLVQLFIIFYGLPSIGLTIDAFTAAVIGFSISVGAYGSEIFRAAIRSIQKGQWEAAYSIGMTRWQALRRVIVPQAIRVSIPPLSNSFISLVKDTSLAATVTVTELFQKAQQITAVVYEPLLLYSEAAVVYLLFSTILSALQSRLEKRYDRFVAH
ncbi:ABC transporter permease subunit [Paenibacillus doosanensis]|uniref:L-cystine transport system permease protein TcyB n=1 Tax=Paenibacillus konkukensis TaxID=2020716 RepID=A0ABY4RE64_9BACL|nr:MULTISPECIES: ABC transporter permease subunit [Paenibacillus]MCS7462291.1 ABC transporter permease subunit [Paenibacillus doosanensis]UQZ80898.1 L-cystine transport system permease protein TcyB [Paenibacillus konkukensis]